MPLRTEDKLQEEKLGCECTTCSIAGCFFSLSTFGSIMTIKPSSFMASNVLQPLLFVFLPSSSKTPRHCLSPFQPNSASTPAVKRGARSKRDLPVLKPYHQLSTAVRAYSQCVRCQYLCKEACMRSFIMFETLDQLKHQRHHLPNLTTTKSSSSNLFSSV